jgi:membrane complex biogenesis BtpA family protein
MHELFNTDRAMVGMIHVGALPGTPYASISIDRIIEAAIGEARLLADSGFDAIMIENMHDRPYLRQQVGPEIVASMSAILDAVRKVVDLPLGVQILAGANKAALATALAGGGQFIRAENFVFAHVADEGLMPDADAASLLRYRRHIGGEHIRIFVDVKKKHASHSITDDTSIAEAAEAAAFFGADAVIVTGGATGHPVTLDDVRAVSSSVELPVAIGSGITPGNLPGLWPFADLFIVGSFIKHDGVWNQAPDPDRIAALLGVAQELREQREHIE